MMDADTQWILEEPDTEESFDRESYEFKHGIRPLRVHAGRIPVIIFVSAFAVLAAVMAWRWADGVFAYTGSFLPGTSVNGIDVSGMTPSEVESILKKEAEFSCVFLFNEGEAVITSEDLYASVSLTPRLSRLLSDQSASGWFLPNRSYEYSCSVSVTWDDLRAKILVNDILFTLEDDSDDGEHVDKALAREIMLQALDEHVPETDLRGTEVYVPD